MAVAGTELMEKGKIIKANVCFTAPRLRMRGIYARDSIISHPDAEDVELLQSDLERVLITPFVLDNSNAAQNSMRFVNIRVTGRSLKEVATVGCTIARSLWERDSAHLSRLVGAIVVNDERDDIGRFFHADPTDNKVKKYAGWYRDSDMLFLGSKFVKNFEPNLEELALSMKVAIESARGPAEVLSEWQEKYLSSKPI
jgi:hypothetical protein